MRIGRRALFFLVTALVCLLMLAPTPGEFRWVNLSMAGLATLWAVLLTIEDVASRRSGSNGPPGVR
ncbi:MAG: hypothetical protein H0W82_04335 [Actinobacteria bacterium]|nr:hypothetical protein [Actinomycetota bacterium]